MWKGTICKNGQDILPSYSRVYLVVTSSTGGHEPKRDIVYSGEESLQNWLLNNPLASLKEWIYHYEEAVFGENEEGKGVLIVNNGYFYPQSPLSGFALPVHSETTIMTLDGRSIDVLTEQLRLEREKNQRVSSRASSSPPQKDYEVIDSLLTILERPVKKVGDFKKIYEGPGRFSAWKKPLKHRPHEDKDYGVIELIIGCSESSGPEIRMEAWILDGPGHTPWTQSRIYQGSMALNECSIDRVIHALQKAKQWEFPSQTKNAQG